MGAIVMVYLDNGIRSATWLNDAEKAMLERHLAEDAPATADHRLSVLFADARLWLLCAIYFCLVMGHYGLTFWMPVLIQAAGVSGPLHIGLVSAIPYSFAVIAMVLVGRHADKTRERRWHTAVPLAVGAAGLVLSVQSGTATALAISSLTLAAIGVLSGGPVFWSLPTAFLGGTAAAAGIAAINSVGNLAGFVSPYIVGWLKDLTGSTAAGLYVVAAALVLGSLLVIRIPGRLVSR
jgi:nitrate/nitrite transporter NarK